MQPKVAVISRTKDRPLLLQRCVKSVLAQTYFDWLHVIINDGGDPAAVEGVVSPFTESYRGRLKIIHNPQSVGMQNASNLAIRASDSEYIAIHDDDDTWNEMFLEECVGHLEVAGPQSTEQGVAVQTWWIMEELNSWGNVVELSRQEFLPFEHLTFFQFGSRNRFPPIAFLYRRKAHEAVGYFDQNFNEIGDYDFNLRFLCHYDIGAIHKKLAGYHWRHQSGGNSYGNTVTDGVAAHHREFVRLQNHYLRKDMAAGRVGLGFMLGIAYNMEHQSNQLSGLHGKYDRTTRVLKKTLKRLEFYEGLANEWLMPWKGTALPRRVFDHVADLVSNGTGSNGAANHDATHPNNGKLEASARKAKVISLDVFDTALMRLVRKPTDVFLYMQGEVRRLLGRPGLNFVEVRIATEREARFESRRARGTDEATLDEIYSALQSRLGCDTAVTQQIKALELQTEKALCYANPQLARLTGALNGSHKLVYSSDMYLPAGEISGLLKHNGFKDGPLFLSSELTVSKHEGALFDRVLSSVNCPPGDLLHIGDNPHSDVARPVSRGIAAHHWARPLAETPLVDQHTSHSAAWEGDLASSLYTGLARRRRLAHPLELAWGSAFWEMIGYEVMGPLHHAYLSWIIDRAAKQGLRKLFFLSRDGFRLLEGFEMFREKFGVTIEAKYLYASRRLWNFARIQSLDEDALSFLTTPNLCMRVGDFLARIGIDPAPHETLARRIGFASLNEPVTNFEGGFLTEELHNKMRRFIGEFGARIIEQAARERKTLMQYFEESGLFEDGVGIVDLGWQASSSRSLQALLALDGRQRRIPAFYFGTWTFAKPAHEAGCKFDSMFVHLGQPSYRSWIVTESVELLESFFSAPHPTVIGLEKRDGKWTPIHGETEVDASATAAIDAATATSFQFIRDALAIWPKNQEVAPAYGYLETTLERLLRHPKKEEAAAFAKFSWRNTFGGAGPLRTLAEVPSSWERIARRDALQNAYNRCYWKKGFLAQLSPKARKYVQA